MKKIISIVALVFVVSLIVLWVIGRQLNPDNILTFEQSNSTTKFVEIDQDNDGLKDWEEGIWGTDALNPDTDGDGTLDGEEIRLRRNPLIPPPDSKLPNIFGTQSGGTNNTSETERLANEVFNSYFLTQNATQGVNSETAGQTLFESIKTDPSINEQNFEPYTILDLNISSSISDTANDAYNSARVRIGDRYVFPELGAELAPVLAYAGRKLTQSERIDSYSILEKAEVSYRAIVQEMLALLVPQNRVPEHLEIINVMNGLEVSVRAMKVNIDDPIVTIIAVQRYFGYLDLLFAL